MTIIDNVRDNYRPVKEIPVDLNRQVERWINGRDFEREQIVNGRYAKRRRGWSNERGGVSSTWINTEERAGASTFCEKQYSRAADTRRTLSIVDPSCKSPRVGTGWPSLPAGVLLRPHFTGGCESPADQERRILRSRARRALPAPACPMNFSFIFVPWYIRVIHMRGTLRFACPRIKKSRVCYLWSRFFLFSFDTVLYFCTFISLFPIFVICVYLMCCINNRIYSDSLNYS